MRKTYHICLSSHDEVMFRREEDFIKGFNCFAEAVAETESRALADGLMTSHEHFGLCSDNPEECLQRQRYRYTRYFNSKYRRNGRIAEGKPFICELDGIRHTVAGISYVMRQGLHHGLTSTPFGYPHCSANSVFRKELGKDHTETLIADPHRRKYLSRNSGIDKSWRMSSSGLLLREDVIDVGYVEELFVSARNFLYMMNRHSGTDWEDEQKEEASASPVITLDIIEKGVHGCNVDVLLKNEYGRPDKQKMTDLMLCEYIDKKLVPLYMGTPDMASGECASVYLLTMEQRRDLGNRLWRMSKSGELPYLSAGQIRRCAVIK